MAKRAWLVLVLAGCRSGASAPVGVPADLGADPGTDLGLAASVLPNLGLAATLGVPVRTGPGWTWRAEARLTDQFLDDKTFADNGDPAAGNWLQLELGLRADEVPGPEQRTIWSLRFGLVGFDTGAAPNLVDEEGEYLGLYAGAGRYTRFGPGLWIGPELTLIAASGEDPRVLIPQLTWGLRWSPAAR